MKIRTHSSLARRALWRFNELCARRQWVPLACLALCYLLVSYLAAP